MNINFNLQFIKENLTGEELQRGLFGLEWESLRVLENGELSLRPHPKIFGNKKENPYITTDFSESQIEIVTPAFSSLDKAFEFFSFITDLINISLPEDEYMWSQSLPCILPEENKIPIAKYKDDPDAMNYRKGLAKKYGLKKQLISGIHYNFSFEDKMIRKLYEKDDKFNDYKEFKDKFYLKIARNYIRYTWFVIYITGCSIAAHESFTKECANLMNKQDNNHSYYSTEGCSFRNASCGYKNLEHLYPDYSSVNSFIKDVENYVNDGILSEPRELYTQIRLKPKNPKNLFESLKKDGIQYIEVRSLDINPFYQCGLIKKDMEFLHLFLIYLLVKEESDYENWQEESLFNEEIISEKAYANNTKLLKDGEEILVKDYALEIIEDMQKTLIELGINKPEIIKPVYTRINNTSLSYSKRLEEIIQKKGFIPAQISMCKSNKKASRYLIHKKKLIKDKTFRNYARTALPGKNI